MKLLYYNLHHQSMKFISASLMEILVLNDSNDFEENTFEKFLVLMGKLRLENKALLRMLMDMIVEEGMVSSEEEFMAVMEKTGLAKPPQVLGNKQLDKLSMAAKKYKESSQMSKFLNIFFTTLRNDTAQQRQ